jgi:hypothetical protein
MSSLGSVVRAAPARTAIGTSAAVSRMSHQRSLARLPSARRFNHLIPLTR